MRTARTRHENPLSTIEGQDSILGNSDPEKLRTTARISGGTNPCAPGGSGTGSSNEPQAISPATSLEKIMNQHVRTLSAISNAALNTEAETGDRLLDAIRSFEAGRDFANRVRGIEDDERDALMDSIYSPFFQRLSNWTEAAPSRKSAVAALRLAVDENDEFVGSPLASSMVNVAFKFFASELECEDLADRRWEIAEAASANEAQKAEVPTSKSYDLNHLDSDTAHLHELLDTIVDSIMDMSFERDGKRDTQLDRICALLWIARDLAGQLSQRITDNFREIGSTCDGYPREHAA
jgi:hypothetical protein